MHEQIFDEESDKHYRLFLFLFSFPVRSFYSLYLINFPSGYIIRAIKIIICPPPPAPPCDLLMDWVRSSDSFVLILYSSDIALI